MFKEDYHWLRGAFPTEQNLAKIDMSKCPEGVPVKDLLRETNAALFFPKKGRMVAEAYRRPADF